MSKKIAVMLSGCGNRDGAEITETVSSLIALSEAGAEVRIFAPVLKFEVVDYLTGEKTSQERDVLQEAGRIARGKIKDLRELRTTDFDALVIPGGFGVAVNLCSWGENRSKGQVHAEVRRVIEEFYDHQKPICAICIAPALVALVLGSKGVTVTVGSDSEDATEIKKTGAHHEVCRVDDFVTDREHRIVTTPAYMYGDASRAAIFQGIRGAIFEAVEMA